MCSFNFSCLLRMACFPVDRILLLQTVLYFVIVTTGLATSISSGLTLNGFGGLCVLYGSVNCSYNPEVLIVSGGRASICTFITAINLLVCVLYAFMCGCYHAYYVHRSKIIVRAIYKLWLRTLLLSTTLVTLLILVSASTLTVGLSMWCSQLQEKIVRCPSLNATYTSYTSCSSDNAWKTLLWNEINHTFPYSSTYYDQYYVAMTSCWVSVVLWIVHLALYIRHLVRQCQLDRSYQEPFTADLFDSFT